MPLTPNNREEYWLQGMVDGETTLTPNKRKEFWYKEIVDAIGSGGGGGGGGGGVLALTEADNTLSETWQTIYDAAAAGHPVFLFTTSGGTISQTAMTAVAHDVIPMIGDVYTVSFGDDGYNAETADDYPNNK